MKEFITLDKEVVRQACDAMLSGSALPPIAIEDAGGGWIAYGRVLRICNLAGLRHAILVDMLPPRPALQERQEA